MVGDKDCVVTKIVCDEAEEAAEEPGYRIKSKNPTQRCGEKGQPLSSE